MIEDYPIIAKSPLFKGLSVDEVFDNLSKINYRIKNYNADQLIVCEGEEVDRLMIVLSGSVKGEMMDFNGRTIKIEDIMPPKPLAVAFMFGEMNRFPVNIVSNSECSLLILDKSETLKLFQSNEVVLQNFLNVISSRSQFLTQKIKMLSFNTIKGKLANYILQQTKGELQEFKLDKSQNQLAELFGVARPSIGRAFKEMNEDAYVNISGKNVSVLDFKGLKTYLSI